MIRVRLLLGPWAVALSAALGACTLIRPVKATPPPAPASFAAPSAEPGSPSAPGDPAAPAARPPGSAVAEPATEGAVWWSAFADPALDAVMQEAMRNNYFLRDVRTLIRENYLDPNTPQGWWWPLQIGIPASTPASIHRTTIGSPPVDDTEAVKLSYGQANLGLTASYQVDLFGNLDARRRVTKDFAEQQRQSTEIAAQNLAEQIANLWFDILLERALKQQIETEIQYGEELLALVKARFDQHLANRLAVLQQEQQLLRTKSQIPPVSARIAVLNSQLTGLLGRLPSPKDELVPLERKLPDVPPAPSLGTPSGLFESSPEMRFARLRVTEIEHRVNQNLSSWLPTIEVVGSAGVIAFEDSKTFAETFAGVRLSWPIFDGGRRLAEAEQIDLTLKRRKWQYELAIKTQVGRVQDALLQEQNQAKILESVRAQAELGRQLLAEARRLFEQGQSDYLPVLNALASLASIEREGLRAQRLLLTYRVQLYRALGGSWSDSVTRLSN